MKVRDHGSRAERVRSRLGLALIELEGEANRLERQVEDMQAEIHAIRSRRERFYQLAELPNEALEQVIAMLRLEGTDG